MAVLISDKNDDLIRGHRAKLNIYDDSLLNQEEINEILNKYFEQFDLEKWRKLNNGY